MLLLEKLISGFVVEYLAGLIIDNGSQVSRVLRAVNIADGVNVPEDLKIYL